jgi:hypothetical protein
MSDDAIHHVRLAVRAAAAGDGHTASDHLLAARRQARTTTRRERQVIEIAAALIAGDGERATGLRYEHLHDFADDGSILARLFEP